MPYKANTIYHIYNQGNNRIPIFYQERNYIFFIKKMRKHLLPFVDILAYCLMPNHFHILVHTKPTACALGNKKIPNSNHALQNLSREIGFLLTHYAKAINKQENRTGSLFRNKTKYKECFTEGFITISGNNTSIRNEYAPKCFDYIHENPVKALLVSNSINWSYSSAKDYAKLRNGTLCNQELASKLGLYF